MEAELIVTHPGGAHFDEVAAISLILAVRAGTVFIVNRREPEQSELDNPGVWIVDVGNRYEPAKRNFDHHQDMDCRASFVLLAAYLELLDTMEVLPWWRFKDSVDRFGPFRASQEHDAGDDLINRNPVETWLTACFASDPEASLPMLKSFGAHMIDDARALKRQVDFWKNSPRMLIAGVSAMIGETTETVGLEEFRRMDKDPPDIVISLDHRGEGWRLFRYEGAPVDFSRIANRPEIAFAHKTGFLAKTRERLKKDDLIDLVSRAVISRLRPTG